MSPVQMATARGNVTGVIHTVGVTSFRFARAGDLYGTALVFGEFGNVGWDLDAR
jgi:hypothetical protein